MAARCALPGGPNAAIACYPEFVLRLSSDHLQDKPCPVTSFCCACSVPCPGGPKSDLELTILLPPKWPGSGSASASGPSRVPGGRCARGPAAGTRGGELAAKYIAAQFQRLGLQPAGDSGTYYHHVPIITLTPTPPCIVAPSARPSWRIARTTCSGRCGTIRWCHAKGDLVFVGYGIVAPEYRLERLRGARRQEQDRGGPGQRSRTARLDDLSRPDPDLLWPLDLQDRRGPAAGRGRHPAGPHDRRVPPIPGPQYSRAGPDPRFGSRSHQSRSSLPGG